VPDDALKLAICVFGVTGQLPGYGIEYLFHPLNLVLRERCLVNDLLAVRRIPSERPVVLPVRQRSVQDAIAVFPSNPSSVPLITPCDQSAA
jgi:hypothetical protein